MSGSESDQVDGYGEARRRAEILRTDPSHLGWVRAVRTQLDLGPYVSASERRTTADRNEGALDR